jgi:hypothetical protein
MDQHTHPSIRDSDVREIRETVEKITTRARPERVNTGIWRLFANAEKFAFRQTLLGYSVSIILLALVPMFPGAPLLGTALSIAILATLLGIAFLVLIPVNGLPLLNTLRKTPFAPLLSLIDDAMTLDLPLVNRLMACDRYAMEFVLVQYRHERLAFEKRGSLLAGPIEKVGLFPALAAFAVIATTMWHNANAWIKVVLSVIPFFYFMNFWGYGLRQEMDRTIALLEYCLAMRAQADPEE